MSSKVFRVKVSDSDGNRQTVGGVYQDGDGNLVLQLDVMPMQWDGKAALSPTSAYSRATDPVVFDDEPEDEELEPTPVPARRSSDTPKISTGPGSTLGFGGYR